MKVFSNLNLPIILIISFFDFIIGKETNYIEIKEFEKIKVSSKNCKFQFEYIPKENENIVYSTLVLNLEKLLNVNYETGCQICLKNYEGEEWLKVNDSSSIYFNKSVISDITRKFIIEFEPIYYDYDDKGNLDYGTDFFLPDSYEFLEFFIFFINHEIPFDIINNAYVFKFECNEKYLTNEYSQDYLKFKIPLLEKDKILKMKIKLKNNKSDDLFIITNISSNKDISYNVELFSNKIDTSKSEYLIKVNYLYEIELLYISLDEEIIDLSNVIDDKFFIFQTQRFYLNLANNSIGFFIAPFETVENGTIIFYNNELEKFKERELESETTSFYIEKMNDISEYYIDINIKNYVVYKFIFMENFEIINETRIVNILPFSIIYLIFPYNIKKEKNNDYYYGLNAEKIDGEEEYIEIIKENKDNTELPTYNFETMILSKYHIIIKIYSTNKKMLKFDVLYSNYIYNNIKIFNARNKNPELMRLINNKGIYNDEEIKECILLYEPFFFAFIDFQGFGKIKFFYYYLNYTITEENVEHFKEIDYAFDYYCQSFFLYIYVKADSYFETYSYSYFKLGQLEDNNYLLFDSKKPTSFRFSDNMIITFDSIYDKNNYNNDDIHINIVISKGNSKKDIYLKYGSWNSLLKRRLYLEKDTEILINSSSLISIYLTKQFQNNDIQFYYIDYDYANNYHYNYMKLVLPYIKDNFTFYKIYGIYHNSYVDDYYCYSNTLKEFKIPLNSNEEVRLYWKIINGYPNKFIYDSLFYGFNKANYPRKIKAIKANIFGITNGRGIIRPKCNCFSLPNKFRFYKCKNERVNMYIGNSHNFLFKKEVNESSFLDFSNYNADDILEIEASKEFLFLSTECNIKNNNIKDLNGNYEYNDTKIFLDYEKPDNCSSNIKYIFAPKDDYFMENFQDECFLYNLTNEKNINESILVTENNDFKQVLKKEYKEYLVTISNFAEYNYYYGNTIIYKPITIIVSQELLDRFFLPPPNSKSKIKFKVIVSISIIFGLLIVLILFIIYKRYRKKNNSSEIQEKVNKMDINMDNLNLNS